MTNPTPKVDLVDQLDELAAKANGPYALRPGSAKLAASVVDRQQHPVALFNFDCGDDADFIVALVNAWPEIRDRLRAAEAVATGTAKLWEIGGFLPMHEPAFDQAYAETSAALEAWRQLQR